MVSILSAIHPETEPTRILTRLKHTQRIPFPRDDMRIGRGWRVAYDEDELMRLVALFELLAIGIVPQLAAGLVSRNWPELAACFALGWVGGRDRSASILLAFEGERFLPPSGDRYRVVVVDAGTASPEILASSRGVALVDVSAVVRALGSALAGLAGTSRHSGIVDVVDGWAEAWVKGAAPAMVERLRRSALVA